MIRLRPAPPLPLNGTPLFRVTAVVVAVSSLSCEWCDCGGGNGFIPPCGVAVVVVMVSSTPCGMAAVHSGFIHPLWCGRGS